MPEVITLGETMVMFSPEQSGPLRGVRRFEKRLAGAESNTAIGLARLGHSCAWISRVGEDEFGHFLLEAIGGEGVDVSQVIFDPEAPTGIMFKELQPGGETKVTYYRKDSAASRLSPADLDPVYFQGARLLYLTGITPMLSPDCRSVFMAALDLAEQLAIPVSFDPNLRLKLGSAKEYAALIREVLPRTAVFLPGLAESRLSFGELQPEALLDLFLQLGAQTIALKLGSAGAWVATAEMRRQIPAFPVVEAVDPVGAGDAFAAGFLAGYLEELPLQECGRMANAMGALALTTSGDYEGLPRRVELDAWLKSRKT
jgi:2-dehydro-3-deoxygluconokinase